MNCRSIRKDPKLMYGQNWQYGQPCQFFRIVCLNAVASTCLGRGFYSLFQPFFFGKRDFCKFYLTIHKTYISDELLVITKQSFAIANFKLVVKGSGHIFSSVLHRSLGHTSSYLPALLIYFSGSGTHVHLLFRLWDTCSCTFCVATCPGRA